MSKSVVFLCVLARSKGGNVEQCRVFVCFRSVERDNNDFQLFGFGLKLLCESKI